MQLPTVSVVKTTLANGLDLILRRQPNLPLVAVNLWYHVGSKNEERSQRGYAHLFEHLMFEGSTHFPGDFFKHLQPLGANINGSTSSDRTNYFVDIPSAHIESVLAMESDRMAHLVPALDESKLQIQKGVVKNEYRQNYANRPYGMVWPLIAEALYPPQHPYNWITIGVMEDLESASLDDVSAFFQRFYVPGNASLAIVGDLEIDQTLAQVERYFGSIPGGTRAFRPWVPDFRPHDKHEIILQDRVELDRVYLVWHSVPHFHDHDAPLGLLADVLARGKASRLYQKLVIDHQLAQDVTVYHSARELAGSFGVTVTLRPSRSIDAVRELVAAELVDVIATGVTRAELDRVITMKTASFLFALEHIGGFGGVADRLNAYNIYRGDPSLITSDLTRYQQVDTDAIQVAASAFLESPPAVSLSVLGRKQASHFPPLDRTIPPATLAPTVYQPPFPRVLQLGNGIPVWVLPHHDLPTVSLTVAMAGGGSVQSPTRSGLAQLAIGMMDEGTLSRSSTEIALAAEAMGTSLSTGCGWDGAFVSFRCLKAHLNASLDLAVDLLRAPSFPEPEWSRNHAQTLAALLSERDSAESRGYRGLLAAIYGDDHPYRHPLDGIDSIVSELTRDEAIEYHRRYLGPSQAGIVVAGDVDSEEIAKLLEQRLADWTGPTIRGPRFLLHRERIIPGSSCSTGPVRPRPSCGWAMSASPGPIPISSRPCWSTRCSAASSLRGSTRNFARRMATPTVFAASSTAGWARSFLDQYLGAVGQAGRGPQRHLPRADGPGRRPAAHPGRARRRPPGPDRRPDTPVRDASRSGQPIRQSLHPRPASRSLSRVRRPAHADRSGHPGRGGAPADPPQSLVAVVVADAAEAAEPLRRLEWAELEIVGEH